LSIVNDTEIRKWHRISQRRYQASWTTSSCANDVEHHTKAASIIMNDTEHRKRHRTSHKGGIEYRERLPASRTTSNIT
jgi:hypothetical protein